MNWLRENMRLTPQHLMAKVEGTRIDDVTLLFLQKPLLVPLAVTANSNKSSKAVEGVLTVFVRVMSDVFVAL